MHNPYLIARVIAVCAAVWWTVSSAQAATICYFLFQDEYGPGTFNLYAFTDAPGGIAGYGVDLRANATVTDHNSPNALQDDGTFTILGPVGFRLGRSPDNINFVVAAHDPINPNVGFLYGVGYAPSDFASQGAGPLLFLAEGDNWGTHPSLPGAPVLLASGTYSGPTLGFNAGGPNLGGYVFPFVGATSVVPAQTHLIHTYGDDLIPPHCIPEPTALVLVGLGMIQIMAWRRG